MINETQPHDSGRTDEIIGQGTTPRLRGDGDEPFQRVPEPPIHVLSVEQEEALDDVYGHQFRGQEIPDELVEWHQSVAALAFQERVREIDDTAVTEAAGRL